MKRKKKDFYVLGKIASFDKFLKKIICKRRNKFLKKIILIEHGGMINLRCSFVKRKKKRVELMYIQPYQQNISLKKKTYQRNMILLR